MTILAPGFEARRYTPVGDWHPSRYTPSLTGTEDFTTDGDRLIAFGCNYCTIQGTDGFDLDEWQKWLIRHALERYPDDWPEEDLRGELRYRQIVISMGRQNGKSLLAFLFVLYFLCLHVRDPRVIGLASVERQAKIVYDRVKAAIDANDSLAASLRATDTRGIKQRGRGKTGIYQTLPAKEDTAQGEPATGVIYDELHLGVAALWDAMLKAQQAQRNSLMIGITTAGDDSSLLLLRLYDEGDAAIRGEDERFGFFVWEAADDALTEANVIAANPAIAAGRVSLKITMSDARKMMRDTRLDENGLSGPQRVKRYTLNRFLEGSARAWIDLAAWDALAVDAFEHGPGPYVFGVHRTDDWGFAAITASTQLDDGRVATEPIITYVDTSHAALLGACRTLAAQYPDAVFTGERRMVKDLLDTLRDEGIEVFSLSFDETSSAHQTLHAAIRDRSLTHPGESIMRTQHGRAVKRSTGEAWRLSQTESVAEIDAVLATAASVHVATVKPPETTIQIF